MPRLIPESGLEVYLKQIRKTALLTKADEQELARKIRDHDCAESRDRMIRANLRLVVAIARRYGGCGLPLSDLIEEGNVGLVRAVESFDPEMGTRFSTYGAWWIKQGIRRALLDAGRPVHVPAYMIDLIRRWQRASRDLQNRTGRPPLPTEIADEMELPHTKIPDVRAALKARRVASQAVSEDSEHDGGPLEYRLPDPNGSSPAQQMLHADQLDAVRRHLDRIEPREATILRLHFGLDGGAPSTLKAIGERIGLTRERVRQLECQALRKLHDRMGGGSLC